MDELKQLPYDQQLDYINHFIATCESLSKRIKNNNNNQNFTSFDSNLRHQILSNSD